MDVGILSSMSDVTRILSQIEQGDPQAADQLLPLVYAELRKLAAAKLAQEKPGQTLQATALVHEAFLRLVGSGGQATFDNRRHFFGAAAEAMRRLLVDQARRKGRDKHGGAIQRVELQEPAARQTDEELLALDAALARLAHEDPVAAEVIKLKYFAGLGREEIAAALGKSVHEVRRIWTYARAWLKVALEA